MTDSIQFGGEPPDSKMIYAHPEAEIAHLKAQVTNLTERLEISEAVVKELRGRLNDSIAKEAHKDVPPGGAMRS